MSNCPVSNCPFTLIVPVVRYLPHEGALGLAEGALAPLLLRLGVKAPS